MKSVTKILAKYSEEIKGNKRTEKIEKYENLLSERIEKLSQNEDFFNLPLLNILSIISKVDFEKIEEKDKIVEIIKTIITGIISKHFEEKETILILQKLNTQTISFTYEEILSFLESITNCPILVNFCNLYKQQKQTVEQDYDYEFVQKDKEIIKLTQQMHEIILKHPEEKLTNFFESITEKPTDYEPDIFKACKEGKLTSVQWLIEKEKVDPYKRLEIDDETLNIWEGDTSIHLASASGHLLIVQYFIEKLNFDPNVKGGLMETPLHCACLNDRLSIVEYLISRGANVNAQSKYKRTPLHYACEGGHLPIVEYLISKDANLDARDEDGSTPLHLASYWGRDSLVKILVSAGANKDIKNLNRKIPLKIACDGYGYDKQEKKLAIKKLLK